MIKDTKQYPVPVAIGALGGSGTRIYAEILREIGLYIGSDLNPALDNLWFTLLFKRPKWFIKHYTNNKSEISKGLHIFEKAMTGYLVPKFDEFLFIMKAALQWSIFGNHFHAKGNSGRGIWPFFRVFTMLRNQKIDSSRYIGWGWKEPNTHIYLEYLNHHFEHLKYIHVVRHGLDMAYTHNLAQLYNWGRLLGLKESENSVPEPKRALQFWIKTNERVMALGQKMQSNRFLLANFDDLCNNPKHEIAKLIDFLGLNMNQMNIDQLACLPNLPESSGRYKKYDLSLFDEDEIEAVRSFGFKVDD